MPTLTLAPSGLALILTEGSREFTFDLSEPPERTLAALCATLRRPAAEEPAKPLRSGLGPAEARRILAEWTRTCRHDRDLGLRCPACEAESAEARRTGREAPTRYHGKLPRHFDIRGREKREAREALTVADLDNLELAWPAAHRS